MVNRGCPQGSALGPLLWNVFQNDLAYEINLNLSMYADDYQIYEVRKHLANVKSFLNRNAEKASKWYEDNMLKGNYSKYKTMSELNKNCACRAPSYHRAPGKTGDDNKAIATTT